MHGLIARRRRVSRVGHERAKGTRAWQPDGLETGELTIGVERGKQAGGDGFDVALGAGDLPGEPYGGAGNLEGEAERVRGVNEAVAVHDAVAQELRVLQARYHPEHATLLGPGEVGLKAYEVVGGTVRVLRTQLHCGPRAPSGPGVGKPHGLERAEAERVVAGPPHLLDGLAGAEQVSLLEVARDDALSREQGLHEGVVLLALHRAVEVVA